MKVGFMNWQEGQQVECKGLDWGSCYVTMSNHNMVVIYCPRYEIVTTATPAQLEEAGWRSVQSNNVIHLSDWTKAKQRDRNPVSTR
jgi:hypothetical protein